MPNPSELQRQALEEGQHLVNCLLEGLNRTKADKQVMLNRIREIEQETGTTLLGNYNGRSE